MTLSNNKTSHLVEGQLPFFVRNDHQGFVLFMEKYYEYLEQDTKAINQINNIRNQFDVDLSEDEYADKLYAAFMNFLPNFAVADKDILIKNIKDFYRAKGTEKATRFLFRILYNKEIELYYPQKDVLRASDGKWFIQKSLRITDTFVNSVSNTSILGLEKFITSQISGNTSNAIATVESVDRYFEQGAQIDELIISNVDGEFVDGETIFTVINDASGTFILRSNVFGGSVSTITINNPGSSYNIGDPVIFISGTGSGACATVSAVSTGNIADISVLYGGAGFRNTNSLLITGGGGTGASGNIATVLDDSSIHPNSYNIVSSTISLEANTPLNNATYSNLTNTGSNVDTPIGNAVGFWTFANTGPVRTVRVITVGQNYATQPTISIIANSTIFGLGILGRMDIENGGSGYYIGDTIEFFNVLGGYGEGASANVTNVDVNNANAINEVKFVQGAPGHIIGGSGYDMNYLPHANVISSTGNGANIIVTAILGAGATFNSLTSEIGAIERITITTRGSGYQENTTIDLTGSGDGTAQATPFVVQGSYSYPGRFLNDDGMLSSYNFLQDRDYYQIFSYVIRSDKSVEDYRVAVKTINHPAGLKLFGEYLYVNEEIGSEVSAAEDANSIYHIDSTGYVNVSTFITQEKTYEKTGNTINISYVGHTLTSNSNVYLEFVTGDFANVQNSIFMITETSTDNFVVKQKSNVANITIVNPGWLYNANSYLVIAGDGLGANASFSVNANGSIVSVNIREPGIRYTYTPTVTANGSNSIAATFTAIISYAGNTSGNVLVTKVRS